MNLSIKTTEYALLPNKAVPLDPREHFDSLGKAIETIRGKVIASDAAYTEDGRDKFFYIGEIISTKEDGIYQVCAGNLKLYADNSGDLHWGSFTTLSNKAPFKIKDKILYYSRDESYTYEYTVNGTTYTIEDFPLKLVSGSGSGGDSLYINPSGGLQNPSTGLSLKIDDSSKNNLTLSESGLKLSGTVLTINNKAPDTSGNLSLDYIKSAKVSNNTLTLTDSGGGTTSLTVPTNYLASAEISNVSGQKLTITDSKSNSTSLNFGDGLKLSSVSDTPDFTLGINTGDNVKISEGKLDVSGIHHYTTTDDESKSIKVGDFAYQLIK